jgi:methanogenic corrinoid protein MtbC1
MVAGAPVSESFAKEIGSDGNADDAILASDVTREPIGGPA